MSKIPRENRPGYWGHRKRLNRGKAQFRIAVQIVRIHDVAHVPEAVPVMTAICASLAPIGAARVKNVALKDGGITEPVSLAAAALHDTIEDTETTEQEVRTLFADASASLVLAMSDAKSVARAARKRQQIEACPAYEPSGRTRELADKIGNRRDVAANPSGHWSVERRREYFEWAKAVIDGLAQVSREPLGLFNAAYAARPHCGDRNGQAPESRGQQGDRKRQADALSWPVWPTSSAL